jgi:aerobic-type carbon monoxide dehydrogenase small subunit (CoxS/CutS family)
VVASFEPGEDWFFDYEKQRMIKGAELLFRNPRPTEAQIRSAMNGHICRCGTYPRILAAIQRASKAMEVRG